MGTYIRAFFGISLPIVQVGGGIVLIAMGWAILSQQDEGCDAANRKKFIRKTPFVRHSSL